MAETAFIFDENCKHTHSQKVQQVPSKIKTKEHIPKPIILKLPHTSDKEKNLKRNYKLK